MSKKSLQILRYILVFFGLVVIAAIAFRIYKIQTEKRNFAKAEQSIDALAQQIEQTIGKPDETKKEKSCVHASRAYEKGPLGCAVAINLLFEKTDFVKANLITHTIASRVGTTLYDSLGRPETIEFTDETEQSFSQSLTSDSNVSCSAQYTHKDETTLIELSCGGETIHSVYPTNNR